MRGRKPKPTKQQIAEGDPRQRGKHKLLEKLAKEPKPLRGFPRCPSHLKGLARKAWKFLTEQIEAMEQDHRPDAIMLEGACVNYARAVEADSILQREGLTITEQYVDKEDRVIPLKIRNRPEIAISNAAWRQVRAFCTEFGLSPASRTRLSIEPSAEDDAEKIAEILSRPRKPRVPPPVIQ